MVPTSFISPETNKLAAWITLALLFLLGAQPIKRVLASILLKLYEVFIQRGQLA